MKFYPLSIFMLTFIYAGLKSLLATSHLKSNTTRSNFVDSMNDHLAQEQRLALQIITTDSDSTSNLMPLSSSANKENESRDGARSMNFDNQYNLLNSQLSKVASQNMITNQAIAPKRIVINLNSLNSNASNEDRGITRLTIGFAPPEVESKDQPAEGKQKADKSNSERSKTYILPDKSQRRDTASTNRSPGSGGSLAAGIRQPNTSSSQRSSLMDGLRQQGGIPAMVMRNSQEMNERKKPQLKFMLQSDTIERHLQREQPQVEGAQQQQRQQQRLTSSIQPSESAVESTKGDGSLHEELENLSGEIDSLNEQLGDQTGRRAQVKRHGGSYNNRQSETSNHLLRQRNLRSYPSEQILRQNRPNDDTYNDSTMTVMSSDNREIDIEAERAHPNTRKENNNYDYAIYKSGPTRNYPDGDERNQELGLVRVDNLASLSHRHTDFHSPQRQVDVSREGVKKEQRNFITRSGADNRAYDFAKLEKSPSEQVDSMHNFAEANRWRQRDSRAPLSADNSLNELLDEQQEERLGRQTQRQQQTTGVDDDNAGRTNDISASVVTGDGDVALNFESSNRQQVDSSSSRGKEKIPPVNQVLTATNGEMKLDDRVAQLLDKLKLYTTRDQLMKVARDLQGYPSREEAMRDAKQANVGASFDATRQLRRVPQTGRNLTFLSTRESMKTSQTKEPRYHYDDSKSAKEQFEDDVTTNGVRTEYRLSSPSLSEVRNIVPGPVEYQPEDSFVTAAMASHHPDRLSNFDNLLQTATDQVEALQPGSENDGRSDNGEGSKLLDEFRERQMRLKSIQEASDSGTDVDGDSEAAAADEGTHKSNPDNITDDSSDADNVPRDNHSQTSGEGGGNSDIYDGTASASENAAAPNPEDANEYSTSRDLLELFKNNARLFDTEDGDGFARRSGELLPPPKENSTRKGVGNDISVEVTGREQPGRENGDEEEDDRSTSNKIHAKEEQEIKALEQIIDELVAREKKEKSESQKAKKRQ